MSLLDLVGVTSSGVNSGRPDVLIVGTRNFVISHICVFSITLVLIAQFSYHCIPFVCLFVCIEV